MAEPAHSLICHTPDGLEQVARSILASAGGRRKFFLRGDLGAGKTALVGAFARCLGSTDEVSSPTFALVQEYAAPDWTPPVIRHIDAYRIRDTGDAWEAGLADYLEDGAWTFVEWPEILADWLPEQRIDISIRICPDSSREIVFLVI